MSIEIKISIKPVDYSKAMSLLEKRLQKVINRKGINKLDLTEIKLK